MIAVCDRDAERGSEVKTELDDKGAERGVAEAVEPSLEEESEVEATDAADLAADLDDLREDDLDSGGPAVSAPVAEPAEVSRGVAEAEPAETASASVADGDLDADVVTSEPNEASADGSEPTDEAASGISESNKAGVLIVEAAEAAADIEPASAAASAGVPDRPETEVVIAEAVEVWVKSDVGSARDNVSPAIPFVSAAAALSSKKASTSRDVALPKRGQAADGAFKGAPALLYVHTRTSLTIALSIVETFADELFVLYYRNIDELDEWFSLPPNLYTTDDREFIMLNMPSFKYIMTFGALPHVNHLEMVVLHSLCRSIGVPTFDMQHGLFQLGINYRDDVRHISFKSAPGHGLPLPTQTLAETQLTWGEPFNIGYPRVSLKYKRSLVGSGYCAVVTNSNWSLYSDLERTRLGVALYTTFRHYSDIKFLWKPHPAERGDNSPVINSFFESGALPPNVEVAQGADSSNDFLERVIEVCDFGIATVGTSLLEFQRYSKPVLVFDCKSVAHLIGEIPEATTFSDADELGDMIVKIARGSAGVGRIRTQYKSELDRIALRSALDDSLGKSSPASANIKDVLEHMDLINRLTWSAQI